MPDKHGALSPVYYLICVLGHVSVAAAAAAAFHQPSRATNYICEPCIAIMTSCVTVT